MSMLLLTQNHCFRIFAGPERGFDVCFKLSVQELVWGLGALHLGSLFGAFDKIKNPIKYLLVAYCFVFFSNT